MWSPENITASSACGWPGPPTWLPSSSWLYSYVLKADARMKNLPLRVLQMFSLMSLSDALRLHAPQILSPPDLRLHRSVKHSRVSCCFVPPLDFRLVQMFFKQVFRTWGDEDESVLVSTATTDTNATFPSSVGAFFGNISRPQEV